MVTRYITKHGEMIDSICSRFYGDESGFVEQVLVANPGLAGLAVPLPPGTEIMLPVIPKSAETIKLITLWD
ncbi:MAG: tail protein X [Notoacmeibacter sp.]|nr:tail protein X [Notoacmeibacter sp.]